jgi:hypothetical protein
MDNISALIATETVVYLLARRDRKGRGVLGMKRTKAEKILAGCLSEAHILTHNGRYVVAGYDLFDNILGYSACTTGHKKPPSVDDN